MQRIALAVAVALLSIPLLSYAGAQPSIPPSMLLAVPRDTINGQWHWLSVEASGESPTGWQISSGIAALKMDGRHFHADLSLAPGASGADLSLDGTIAGDDIRAVEIVLNTDANPATITGKLRRTRLGNAVETRIVFRGGQSGDASFLGLYRVTPREADRP